MTCKVSKCTQVRSAPCKHQGIFWMLLPIHCDKPVPSRHQLNYTESLDAFSTFMLTNTLTIPLRFHPRYYLKYTIFCFSILRLTYISPFLLGIQQFLICFCFYLFYLGMLGSKSSIIKQHKQHKKMCDFPDGHRCSHHIIVSSHQIHYRTFPQGI